LAIILTNRVSLLLFSDFHYSRRFSNLHKPQSKHQFENQQIRNRCNNSNNNTFFIHFVSSTFRYRIFHITHKTYVKI
jgi:hypothetical protein